MSKTSTCLATTLVQCVPKHSSLGTHCRSIAIEITKTLLASSSLAVQPSTLMASCSCNSVISGNLDNVNSCIQRVDQNLYHCLKCGKTCAAKKDLVTHVENSHFPGNYPCCYCTKVYSSRNSLVVHKRTHKILDRN